MGQGAQPAGGVGEDSPGVLASSPGRSLKHRLCLAKNNSACVQFLTLAFASCVILGDLFSFSGALISLPVILP